MSAPKPVNIAISDGEATDRILDAFKYAFDPVLADPIRVWFEIETTSKSISTYRTANSTKTRVSARIIGVEYDTEFPGMFILKLMVLDGTYTAFYNANNQKGVLIHKI